MNLTTARIEKDVYRPKNRAFDESRDIRWRVVYPNPYKVGVKKESYRTQGEAEKRLEEIQNVTNPHLVLSHKDWTVKDVLGLWKGKKLVKLKSYKIECYKIKVLEGNLGDVKVRELSEEHIARLKNWFLSNGKSIRTSNAYLVTLRTALNYAKRKGVCKEFPDIAEHIESSLEVKRERVITSEEFERLLEACTVKKSGRARAHLQAYLLWLHETGMRTGELAKVKADDIHLDKGVVRVWSGKSKRPVQRECGISPRLRQWILENQPLKEGLLFPQREWKRSFATACRIAKINNLRLHDLRRTAITNMLEKGIPLHLVAKMVGHSANSVLTLDVYTRFRFDYIQREMKRMEVPN